MTSESHRGRVYLDSLAGQPPSPEALSAWTIAVEQSFAATSGHHFEASISRQFTEAALGTLSRLWQVPTQCITPVVSLSVAFRMVVESVDPTLDVALNPLSRRGLIGLVTERSTSVTELAVDSDGNVDYATDAKVIFTQAGNQEIGTISAFTHNAESLVVVDATEWVGRMPQLPHGDVIIARADAWGGLHDVCFIIDVHSKLKLNPRMRTANAPDVASLVASASALENVDPRTELVHREIIDSIRLALAPTCIAVGDSVNRLPHILTLVTQNVDGQALASELDSRGYAVGANSACIVETATPSHVLARLGHPSNNNIRLSLPLTIKGIEEFDVQRFADVVTDSIASLQQ